MRRKDVGFLPIVDDTELLDTQEQEKIVRSLEESHVRQSFIWRLIFAVITGTFSVFFLVSSYWQIMYPWETKYHAYFMDDMDSMSVVIADTCAAALYAALAWGIYFPKAVNGHLLRFSFGSGFILALFWLYYMQRLPRPRWDLLWLPFGPSSCAAICLYVDHLILETGKEIDKLREALPSIKYERANNMDKRADG